MVTITVTGYCATSHRESGSALTNARPLLVPGRPMSSVEDISERLQIEMSLRTRRRTALRVYGQYKSRVYTSSSHRWNSHPQQATRYDSTAKSSILVCVITETLEVARAGGHTRIDRYNLVEAQTRRRKQSWPRLEEVSRLATSIWAVLMHDITYK